MPVPFRDLSEDAGPGLAGFLRFEQEPDGKGVRAALFLISSRGEPIEFSFTRIDVVGGFLWRAGEAQRHAVTALSRALFEASSRQPALLLALAEEVPPRVFTEDLEVRVPLCRIASGDAADQAAAEMSEPLAGAINLLWSGEPPAHGSPARQLLEALHARQLLTEPFERASVGLGEAFGRA